MLVFLFYSPQLDSMIDGLGALFVGGILVGAAGFVVVYAIYAAIRFGIEGQPMDVPSEHPVELPGGHPASGPAPRTPEEKKAA